MSEAQLKKLGCGCMLLTVALCLLLTVIWAKLLNDRQERVLVRYSPETAEALCEHFGWDSEPFCTQTDLQNARVFNDLLDEKFPDPAYYTDLEPYTAMLPAYSSFCYPEPGRPPPEGCPPPEQCRGNHFIYYCYFELPDDAGDLIVELSVEGGYVRSIFVVEYPESM